MATSITPVLFTDLPVAITLNSGDQTFVIQEEMQGGVPKKVFKRIDADKIVAASMVELTAETGAGTDVSTPAIPSGTIASVLQAMWGKIRQIGNTAPIVTSGTFNLTATGMSSGSGSWVKYGRVVHLRLSASFSTSSAASGKTNANASIPIPASGYGVNMSTSRSYEAAIQLLYSDRSFSFYLSVPFGGTAIDADCCYISNS